MYRSNTIFHIESAKRIEEAVEPVLAFIPFQQEEHKPASAARIYLRGG